MICLVTDRHRLSAGADAVDRLVELVTAAVHAGIDLIQIRERDLDSRALTALVRRCVAAAEASRTKVLVNDRVDVAIAAGAHGVHLRADSMTADAARSLIGDVAVIGRSIHSAPEAVSADGGAVDYLLFGTMYSSRSKTPGHPLATVDELSAASRAGVPVLAIGGLTIERAEHMARAGAAGIAAIGLFVPPPGTRADQHLQIVTAGLRRVFDTCGAVS
jgi:thiamine-phosphate diphosphorylase